MKIALHITVEIDAQVWSDEYGCDKGDVRDDVRSYVQHVLHEMPVRPASVVIR